MLHFLTFFSKVCETFVKKTCQNVELCELFRCLTLNSGFLRWMRIWSDVNSQYFLVKLAVTFKGDFGGLKCSNCIIYLWVTFIGLRTLREWISVWCSVCLSALCTLLLRSSTLVIRVCGRICVYLRLCHKYGIWGHTIIGIAVAHPFVLIERFGDRISWVLALHIQIWFLRFINYYQKDNWLS